ncbi:MAG TPA: TlpA disulfide reductase family protein [Hymenobacter sp.]|uniref:TlpA family protein disulfide reductase n=1 Tax=Hymenobacter sp. TaxID=1898978 RepID=UPI002ED83DB5
MNKPFFWRGYLLGLLLPLGLAGAFYLLVLRQPNVQLADMPLVDLDGRPVATAQFAGRPVVVNYWATWCAPCVEEFPLFEQAKKQAGAGVVFLMVSDEPAGKIRAFRAKHAYTFTYLRVREPLPGVNVRPVTYGYDKRGALVSKETGGLSAPALRQLLESL